jgi:hypothetical protein
VRQKPYKSSALRILSLVCRRSLPTTDISSAAFYDACHRMHPTLLIDETRTAGHQRTLLHLLRCSNSRGFFSLRKGKAEIAYGPKVLAWLELPNDAALNSRCIIIPMHRTARADLKRGCEICVKKSGASPPARTPEAVSTPFSWDNSAGGRGSRKSRLRGGKRSREMLLASDGRRKGRKNSLRADQARDSDILAQGQLAFLRL